jgi:glycosyltransferase involved in cell wall biosynthesis
VSELRGLLLQADILCSPRISGENTSMKTYSYLHSGRAIVATDLPTNTQVLNALNARLTAATPQAYSEGILELLENQELRDRIAKTAFAEAEQKYTLSAFSTQINQLYQRVSTKISL